MPTAEDDCTVWLTEGHRIVAEWDRERDGSLLSVVDAAVLAERIRAGAAEGL